MSTHTPMQIGMVGLGPRRDGRSCVVYDVGSHAVAPLHADGAAAMRKGFGGHNEKRGGGNEHVLA